MRAYPAASNSPPNVPYDGSTVRTRPLPPPRIQALTAERASPASIVHWWRGRFNNDWPTVKGEGAEAAPSTARISVSRNV